VDFASGGFDKETLYNRDGDICAAGRERAHAQQSLDSVRIAAKDPVALARFYQAAFGMHDVNRVVNPGCTEIFLNLAPQSKPRGPTKTR
jgi:hypothetical protein